MIGADAGVSTVKMVAVEGLVFEAVEIDGDSNYMVMTLINKDIIVLVQIVVLRSDIQYLKTVVFFLVSGLANVVIQEQYP